MIRFIPTEIPGVIVIEPHLHRDERGFFLETFHRHKYAAGGVDAVFVQDNHSSSARDTLRGLHLQVRKPQGKLVRAVAGEIWDVVVDLRIGSPTFRRWTAVTLSGDSFRQLYVPEGCAHGFCVISDRAEVEYKCTESYDPQDEAGIRFDDPALAIPWPVSAPILSARDRENPSLATITDRLASDPDAAAVYRAT